MKKVLKEYKNLICVFVPMILIPALFPLLPIWGFFDKYFSNSYYWTNYWQVVGAILGFMGAILVFFWEAKNKNITSIKKEHRRFRSEESAKIISHINTIKNKDCNNEDDVYMEFIYIFTILLQVNSVLDKQIKHFIDDKDQYNFYDIKNEISEIMKLHPVTVDKISSDYTELFKNIIIELDSEPKSDGNNADNKSNVIKNKSDSKDSCSVDNRPTSLDSKLDSTSCNESTSISDSSDKDIDVLGHWILNKSYAKRAKYLIGVSTKTKRVVRVFELADNGVDEYNEETGRIKFKEDKTLYRDDASKGNKSSFTLSELDNWTAMNPVLYFNSYRKSKGITTDNEELDKYIKGYKNLGDRDIIVVRTYKFGE